MPYKAWWTPSHLHSAYIVLSSKKRQLPPPFLSKCHTSWWLFRGCQNFCQTPETRKIKRLLHLRIPGSLKKKDTHPSKLKPSIYQVTQSFKSFGRFLLVENCSPTTRRFAAKERFWWRSTVWNKRKSRSDRGGEWSTQCKISLPLEWFLGRVERLATKN